MVAPHFPVPFEHIRARVEYADTPSTETRIGSLTFVPIPLSHPNAGFGYKFMEDGKSFVFLTDNELGYIHPNGRAMEAYIDFAADAGHRGGA